MYSSNEERKYHEEIEENNRNTFYVWKEHKDECSKCYGNKKRSHGEKTCSRCGGEGCVDTAFGGLKDCPTCLGDGKEKVDYRKCDHCNGKGYTTTRTKEKHTKSEDHYPD